MGCHPLQPLNAARDLLKSNPDVRLRLNDTTAASEQASDSPTNVTIRVLVYPHCRICIGCNDFIKGQLTRLYESVTTQSDEGFYVSWKRYKELRTRPEHMFDCPGAGSNVRRAPVV